MSTSSQQNAVIITVAVLFIGVSIAATLFFSGRMPGMSSSPPEVNKGYQNITLTDAGIVCEKEVRKRFGESLKEVSLDSRSSRYSKSDYAYRTYFEVKTVDKRKNMGHFYINCYVHADRGDITMFEVHEDIDSP